MLAVFGPDVAVWDGACAAASEVEGPEEAEVRRAGYGEADVKGDTAAAAALVDAG